ncbi:hypothetical protein PV326_011355 [Microctonus aethiopoides]|nr:hypothetical protein PV326_011355 [Microctonus aethiopoides]
MLRETGIYVHVKRESDGTVYTTCHPMMIGLIGLVAPTGPVVLAFRCSYLGLVELVGEIVAYTAIAGHE